MTARFLTQKRLEIVREASNYILNCSLSPKTILAFTSLIGELHRYVIDGAVFKYEPINWIYPDKDLPSDEKND